MMLPIETIYVFQNDRTLDFKEATNALSCPLAITRGRFQGTGFRAWLCAIGRTRQDEESSGSHYLGSSYQDHPPRPKRSKNSSKGGKGAVKKSG
jgi:hypothetical protein